VKVIFFDFFLRQGGKLSMVYGKFVNVSDLLKDLPYEIA
jgi:hypothetical protein